MLHPAITVDNATIKPMQIELLGQLVLETLQHSALYAYDPSDCPLPVRRDIYNAMLCGDFTRLKEVLHIEEDRLKEVG
jgi:hypothetical protein